MKLKRKLNHRKLGRVSQILKTIAHPLRLEILLLMEEEEPISVSEIQQRIGPEVEQSLLSHHLGKMKDRGILLSQRRGKFTLYSIADREVLQVFDCMENCNL